MNRIGDILERVAMGEKASPDDAARLRVELNRLQGRADVPVPFDKGSDIASAAALILGQGDYFHVTGTTTITSISPRPPGDKVWLEFDGALTLTHNATSLILMGATNLTTAAGDVLGFVSESGGNWREISRRLAASGDASEYLGGDGQFHPLPINVSLFFDDTDSDISGYETLTTTRPTDAKTSIGVSVSSADTVIQEFALAAGEFDFISAQVLHAHLHLEKTSGTKDVDAYVKVFHRTSGGTETLIGTSATALSISTDETEYDFDIAASDTQFAATDRFVAKVFGSPSGGGSTPELTLYFEGDTNTRCEIGTNLAAASNALLDGSIHTDTVAQAVTRGSLIYGNSTPKWDELAVGSARKFLQSDGTDVSWQFGTLDRVSEQTASDSATLNFTGLDSTYRYYLIVLRNIKPATDSVELQLLMSINGGSSYLSSNYRYHSQVSGTVGTAYGAVNSNSDSKIVVTNAIGNAASEACNGEIRLYNMASTANMKSADWHGNEQASNDQDVRFQGSGSNTTTSAVDAVRLQMSSGNIASGTATLYGVV